MYALEGAIASAGSTISWLKDNIKMIDQAAETEKLALEVSDSNGVYFVPAFQGLYAPYWLPKARGLVLETDGYYTFSRNLIYIS